MSVSDYGCLTKRITSSPVSNFRPLLVALSSPWWVLTYSGNQVVFRAIRGHDEDGIADALHPNI